MNGVRRVWILAALSGASVAVGVACGSSSSGGSPGPDLDGSTSGDDGASATDGHGGGDDGGAGDAGSDASQGPRDPFAQQWAVTSDFPSSSDYVADADAGIVTDKKTGLVWTRAAIDSTNVPDGGDPETAADARAQCAAAVVGGQTGWRLPTRVELLSIVSLDESLVFAPGAFDVTNFYNLPIWVNADDATRNAYYEGHYFVHSLAANLVGTWASASLACVKAPYPVTDHAQPVDPNRFVMKSGVLADKVTGLEWWPTLINQSMLWSAANDACTNLASGDAGAPAGAKPWRLPTLKEAASLWIESAKGLPAALNVTPSNFYMWTSAAYTPKSGHIANSGHFRIFFDNKNPAGDIFWDVNDFAPAFCVRDGA